MSQLLSLKTSIAVVAVALVILCIAVELFRRLINRTGLPIDKRIEVWEVFGKVVTLLVATIGGLMAFLRYVDQRELELAASNLEAAQKVREFNIRIYGEAKTTDQATRILLNEAADLCATIATLDDPKSPIGMIATDRFERLYHGQLALYESTEVSNAMVNFRDALLRWRRMGERPSTLPSSERTDPDLGSLNISKRNSDLMRQLALKLSFACQKQLSELDRATNEPKTMSQQPNSEKRP